MYKKRNRKPKQAVRGTLEQKHNEKMNAFDDKKASLSSLRSKLYNLRSDLSRLERTPAKDITEYLMRQKADIKDQIDSLQDEIKRIENDEDTLDYISSAKEILEIYYSNDVAESTVDTSNLSKNHVLSYLMCDQPKTVSDKPNKNQLYAEYLFITDYGATKAEPDEILCEECNGVMKPIDDGYVECENCGLTDTVLPTWEKPNYNEPVIDTNNYTYKRKNHLIELLSQIQAKESTEIPDEIMFEIINYCESRTISLDDLDYIKLRKIMRTLKLPNKYQEHAHYILQKINGKEPPYIPPEIEVQLIKMFEMIQEPFMKHCPAERKNFMKYYYFLHKACELLEQDQLTQYFPLLKNPQKLAQHDQTWKKICKEVRWEFIPSI